MLTEAMEVAAESIGVSVNLPEGVSAEASEGVLVVTGPNGRLEKGFNPKKIAVEVKNGAIVVSPKASAKKKILAIVNATAAHAKNMVRGVTKGFEKKLFVVFAHFPITVEAKGKEVLVKNFLGEKVARRAEVVGQTRVVVSGQEITVSGPSKEDVGQTAANIVEATRVGEKDERVFQDGIYYA